MNNIGRVAAACLALTGGIAGAAETGAELFQENCAACHGAYAEGDGPATAALAVPVPDLTTLAARHGGRYPADSVRAVVDGRNVPAAHGSRSMPIWGTEFWLEGGADDEATRKAASRIQTLVDYLETLQGG
jgi:mono/diheme cytochrome c family protein